MDVDIERGHGGRFEIRVNLDADLAELLFHIALEVFFGEPQPFDIGGDVFHHHLQPFEPPQGFPLIKGCGPGQSRNQEAEQEDEGDEFLAVHKAIP